MMTSLLLRHGAGHVGVLLQGLTAWMERKGFGSTDEVRGMLAAMAGTSQPDFGRAGYLNAIERATRTYGPQ